MFEMHHQRPLVYRSKLEGWDHMASVRTKPHRQLADDDSLNKLFFPPELLPVVQHRLVMDLGDRTIHEMLVRRLYLYLDFTSELEHKVVNRVSEQIADGRIGVDLPEEMRIDAYRIYCDEAYHALFSAELKHQIEHMTGILPSSHGTPRFLQRLTEIRISAPTELRSMVEIFFTIVSETLISATLARIPHDSRVVDAVRQVVADHAEDEGRHHAYFASLLEFLWPQLSAEQQSAMGPLLPEFIMAFLEPDYGAIAHELAGCGLRPSDVELITHETYPRHQVVADAADAASATLHLFSRYGVFDNGPTLEAFQRSGLVK